MFFEWVVKCEFPATGRNVYVTNTLREIARTILSIPTCGFLEFFFIAPMETRSTGVRCSRANRRPTTFMVAYFVQWLSEIPKGSWNLCATEVSVVELECKTWHTWASEINGKCRGEIYWRCGPQARQARPAVSSISSFTLLSNHPCLTFRNRTYS